jgi:LuxR family maltose regulon positive regulatory protein
VLVSAPAGFGKTVLAVDWLTSLGGAFAWLSLERLDDDPSRFCAHLAAAIAGLRTPGSERVADVISRLSPQEMVLPEDFDDVLAEMGPEPVLVLDDLHEVEAPGPLRVVEALLAARGPALRVVVLTRVDPPFALARLRAAGELLELRERDLRFSEDEALRLFASLLPDLGDAGLVRLLGERTEGWAVGLRLAAIAMQGSPNPREVVEAFTGTHRFVMDYLLEEALGRQEAAVQQFLMDTSILRRFRPETCAAVTAQSDRAARARLSQVARANLFLVPLGEDGLWYRYHHLFAELLRFRLRREQAGREEELHRRACAWYEREGDIVSALEHASQMEDRRRILELLDAHALDMLSRSELATLRHWMGRLPRPVPPGYPMLACVLGWLRVVTERKPDVAAILRDIAVALEEAPPDYDPALRRRATVERDVITAFAARHQGRLEEALRISEGVLGSLAEGDAFTRGLLTFNMARVHQTFADMEPAETLLATSFDDSLRSGNFFVALSALGHRAAVQVQAEGVRAASESLASAASFAQGRALTRLPAFATVLYNRGHVALLCGDLDAAEADFRAAVELGRGDRLPEGHANGLVGLARVAMARRDFDRAEALLVEAAALGEGTNLVLPDTNLGLERARLAWSRASAGEGVFPGVPDADVQGARWTSERETAVTLALWHALERNGGDGAAALAGELLRESEARGRGPAMCTALVVQALLAEGADRWTTLDQALAWAAPRDYVRPFLEGGETVRALLRASLVRDLSPPARLHAMNVLAGFDRQGGAERGPASGSVGAAALPEPLTDREEEVLACLFRGQSNKEMARALFVSVDTVKTHLKRVYAKLGVTDRATCVMRATELGLGPGEAAAPPRW